MASGCGQPIPKIPWTISKIRDAKPKARAKGVLLDIESAEDLDALPNIKRMSAHPMAHRARVGTYRIGLYKRDGFVELARIPKRNDIYKVFPKTGRA